jgi:Fe-S-cluster-containing dehydrogenase component
MDENKKVDKKLTRREFLKDAGLIAGGAALGSVAIVSACTTEKTVTQTITQTNKTTQTANVTLTKQGEISTLPPVTTTVTSPPVTTTVTAPPVTSLVNVAKSGCISWDSTKCMACSRCVVACSTYHEKALSPVLSGIFWEEEKEFLAGFQFRQPLFCQQCSAPECYFACPLKDKALCIDPKTGARYINKANCNGCGICVLACPFTPARINLDTTQKKAIKCDLCKDRTDRIVAKLTVTTPGSGYTSAPTVTFSGGGGSGARATAQIGSPVASVTVTAGGSGYTSAPTVTFSSGGGTGAAGTATVANGAVTAITVTNAGTGYTSAPRIAFSGGGGTGATATAVLGPGSVISLIINWGGSGYTSAPTVALSGGGGTGAAATTTLSTGQVCIDVCDRGALSLVPAAERL